MNNLSRRSALVLFFGGAVAATTPLLARRPQAAPPTNAPLPRTKTVAPAGRELATFAGGCFWCVEAVFRDLKGVDKVTSGYSGGFVENPSYEQVCTGDTGHAETLDIVFDPKVIPFADLVRIFLTTHNPTTLNQQGNDVGTQYRSAIFYHSSAQQATARKVIAEVEAAKIWKGRIVTEITPFANFYAAEEYHQDYFKRNPDKAYCQIIIAPKVRHFREQFAKYLKPGA